mmetsp:Transcript_87303/g.260458  ORF Transcript_87303/g.260458 Transcript_87303/m.260458 type:complete len:410 (+) Transcript_87303:314-1543(+)
MGVLDFRSLDEAADRFEGGLALVPRPGEPVLHGLEAKRLASHVQDHNVAPHVVHGLVDRHLVTGLGDHNTEFDLPRHLHALGDLNLTAGENAGAHGAHVPLRLLVVLGPLLLLCEGGRQHLPLVVADGAHNLLPLHQRVDGQVGLAASKALAGQQRRVERADDGRRDALLLAHANHRAEEVVQLARPPSPDVAAAAGRGAHGLPQHLDPVLKPRVLVGHPIAPGQRDDLLHGAAPHLQNLRRLCHDVLRDHGPAGGLDTRGRTDEGKLLPDLGHGTRLKVTCHTRTGFKDRLDLQGLGYWLSLKLPKRHVGWVGRPVTDHAWLLNCGDDVAATGQSPSLAPARHDAPDLVEALHPVLQGEHQRAGPAPGLAHAEATLCLPGFAAQHDDVGLEDLFGPPPLLLRLAGGLS